MNTTAATSKEPPTMTDATRPTDDEVLEPLCSNCGGLGEISDGLSSATCRQCDGRGRLTTPQPHIAAEPFDCPDCHSATEGDHHPCCSSAEPGEVEREQQSARRAK